MQEVDSTTYENTYTSACEVFEFRTQPPEHVFCYPVKGMHETWPVTWTGEVMGGCIHHKGRPFTDNFGGKRQAVSFVGSNGYWYHGYRYMGVGDYIRAKRGKPSKMGYVKP